MATSDLFGLAKPQSQFNSGGDVYGAGGSPPRSSPQGPNIFDIPSPFPNDPGWPPKKGGWAVGDVANVGGNLANWMFSNFSGLTPQTVDIYNQILSGQVPEIANQLSDQVMQYFNSQLLQPMIRQNIAQIQSQVPQTMRQIDDSLQGGMRAQAESQAIQAPIKAIADSTTALQTQLGGNLGMNVLSNIFTPLTTGTFSGAMEAGQNAPMRAWQMLRDIGVLRNQEKQTKAASGGGGGGIFK